MGTTSARAVVWGSQPCREHRLPHPTGPGHPSRVKCSHPQLGCAERRSWTGRHSVETKCEALCLDWERFKPSLGNNGQAMGSFVLVFQQLLMIYGMFCSAACLSFPLSTLPVSIPSPFQLLLPPLPIPLIAVEPLCLMKSWYL